MNTVSTVPWWYVAILAGGFTLLGALIGFFTSFVSDRRKLAREDRRQWDPKIVELVGEALATYRELTKPSHLILRFGPPDEKQLEGFWRLNLICEELNLIASEALIVKARAFQNAAYQVVNQKSDEPYDLLKTAANGLLMATRQEIRVRLN